MNSQSSSNLNQKKPMKRIIKIIGGLAGIAVGLGLLLPALAMIRAHGMLPHLGLLLLGLLLALGGVGAAIHGVARNKT